MLTENYIISMKFRIQFINMKTISNFRLKTVSLNLSYFHNCIHFKCILFCGPWELFWIKCVQFFGNHQQPTMSTNVIFFYFHHSEKNITQSINIMLKAANDIINKCFRLFLTINWYAAVYYYHESWFMGIIVHGIYIQYVLNCLH